MIAGSIYVYMNTLKGASNFKDSTFKSAHICTFKTVSAPLKIAVGVEIVKETQF